MEPEVNEQNIIRTEDPGTDTQVTQSETVPTSTNIKEELVKDSTEEQKSNCQLTKPIFKKSDANEISFLSYLPFDNVEAMQEEVDKAKNVNLKGSKEHSKWKRAVEMGSWLYYKGNPYKDIFTNKNKKFTQTIENPETRTTIGVSLGNPTPKSGLIQGDMVVQIIRKRLGLGSTIFFPLIHSGICLVLKSPAKADLIQMYHDFSSSKVSLGRDSRGLIFSSSTAILDKEILQLIKENIHDSNVTPEVEANIFDYIDIRDKSFLIAGFADCIYPEGYEYHAAMPMEDPSKPEIRMNERISIRNTMLMDQSVLSSVQLNMLSHKLEKKYTASDLKKYKDEFSVGQFRQVDLGHGISIQLEFPSISRYIDDSMSWINSTIAMADRSLTVTNNDNERDNLIIKLANMNMMRIYTHYIKKIIIDDSEITDTETKENSINTISEDLIIRDKFLEEVVKYTTDYTYSITGYPALTNKEAEESYKTIFPSMVSYDPGSFFFILLVQLESPVS